MILEDKKGFTLTQQVPFFEPRYMFPVKYRIEATVKGINDPVFTDVIGELIEFYPVGSMEKIGKHNVQRYKER